MSSEPGFVAVFINMARDVERRATMEAQLSRLALSFARQEAVVGDAVPFELRPVFFDDSGDLLCTLRKGEVGCYASHLLVARRVAAGEWDRPVLVLEDDQDIPADVVALLNQLLQKLPADWNIVRLSDNLKCAYLVEAPLAAGRSLVRYSKAPRGTGAYLLNAAGARKMLRLRPRDASFDVDLVHVWHIDLTTYGVAPPPFQPLDMQSSIDALSAGRLSGIRRFSLKRAELGSLPKHLAHNIPIVLARLQLHGPPLGGQVGD